MEGDGYCSLGAKRTNSLRVKCSPTEGWGATLGGNTPFALALESWFVLVLDASTPGSGACRFARDCSIELAKSSSSRGLLGPSFASADGFSARKMSLARYFLSACDGLRLLGCLEYSKELEDCLY